MADDTAGVRASDALVRPNVRFAAAVLSLPGTVLTYVFIRAVADEKSAELVAPAIPATALAALEYVNWRKQGPQLRLEATIQKDYYRPPVMVAIYLLLALQVVQGLIGFLVGAGVASALSPYKVEDSVAQKIAVDAAIYVVVPIMAATVVLAARTATYRIRQRVLLWLVIALLLNILLNLVQAVALVGVGEFTTADNLRSLVLFIGVIFAIYLAAAVVGMRWARRTEATFVLARAYRQLTPDNQAALASIRR